MSVYAHTAKDVNGTSKYCTRTSKFNSVHPKLDIAKRSNLGHPMDSENTSQMSIPKRAKLGHSVDAENTSKTEYPKDVQAGTSNRPRKRVQNLISQRDSNLKLTLKKRPKLDTPNQSWKVWPGLENITNFEFWRCIFCASKVTSLVLVIPVRSTVQTQGNN